MRKHESGFRGAALMLSLSVWASNAVPPSAAAQAHEQAVAREIEIVVEGAYKPNRIEVRQGERVRLKILRKEYNGCTREIVFPKLNIRRELPTSKIVYIDLPALQAGEYEFKCGMNMVRGTIIVTGHHHHG